MDSFLTKLFEEPRCSPELLGEDPWVFSCKCHKYYSSNSPHAEVDVSYCCCGHTEAGSVITNACLLYFDLQEQWFECSKCKIWAHVRCIHPDLANSADEDLPQSLLCHRCIIDAAGGKPRALSSGGVGRRSGTATKIAVRGSLGKRKKEAVVSAKKKAAKVPASAVMLSPPKKPQVTPKANQPGVVTAKSATKDRAAVRKYLTIKGSTIRFEDTEVRLTSMIAVG
ncbi:unnamed protein product [Phytophthora lilii]|uniref:Unnamed protein product n=1 Tax=Phytophthora lilii TaxID=2077276 RepID=A0A9W6TIK3_9STRA|nr:unnamed protein product [Phytophthora lilii]